MANQMNRRTFIQRSVTLVGAGLVSPSVEAARSVDAPVGLVPLGRTGARISRIGIGTGSQNGEVQRRLGQAGFDRLVRHAFDRGVTYLDTADNYQTHQMVAAAIKGLPRERLFIQTKMPWHRPEFTNGALQTIDRYRRELGTDYIDSLLIHCTTEASWPGDLRRMMDAFSEAKEKGLIRLKGVSCHGLHPLRSATTEDWVDVHLVRVNPQGRYVDNLRNQWEAAGDVDAVMREVRAMHGKGRGVIGMKLVGNGTFRTADDREHALRFAMTCGCVDAVVIGFASTDELDESCSRLHRIVAA